MSNANCSIARRRRYVSNRLFGSPALLGIPPAANVESLKSFEFIFAEFQRNFSTVF